MRAVAGGAVIRPTCTRRTRAPRARAGHRAGTATTKSTTTTTGRDAAARDARRIPAMPARLTVRERPATAEELADLSVRWEEGSWTDVSRLVPAAAAALLCYGLVAGWSLGAEIFLALPVLWGLSMHLGLRQFAQRIDHRRHRDTAAAIVQELQLTGAEPLAIPGHHSSVEPAYAFACSGGNTVVLLGQDLWNPALYGA